MRYTVMETQGRVSQPRRYCQCWHSYGTAVHCFRVALSCLTLLQRMLHGSLIAQILDFSEVPLIHLVNLHQRLFSVGLKISLDFRTNLFSSWIKSKVMTKGRTNCPKLLRQTMKKDLEETAATSNQHNRDCLNAAVFSFIRNKCNSNLPRCTAARQRQEMCG